MVMTKTLLEKQNKDLKIRLTNLRAKKEMAEVSFCEEIHHLKEKIRYQDKDIKMLQKEIAFLEKDKKELTQTLLERNHAIEVVKTENAALREQRDKYQAMLKKE